MHRAAQRRRRFLIALPPVSARVRSLALPLQFGSNHPTQLVCLAYTTRASRPSHRITPIKAHSTPFRTTTAGRMVKVADLGKLLLLALTHPGEARSLITYKVTWWFSSRQASRREC